MKRIFALTLILLFVFNGIAMADGNNYLIFPFKDKVPRDKVWTITFSKPLDPSTVNYETVYVLNSNSMSDYGMDTIKLTLSEDKKSIIVKNSYKYHGRTAFFINITTKVKSADGQPLKKKVVMGFFTKEQTPYE